MYAGFITQYPKPPDAVARHCSRFTYSHRGALFSSAARQTGYDSALAGAAMKMLAKIRSAIRTTGRLQLRTPFVERDENSSLDRHPTDVGHSWNARIGICTARSSTIGLLAFHCDVLSVGASNSVIQFVVFVFPIDTINE